MTRLLLVEDHVLVRQSIRAFLQGAALEVVGEAGTGFEAVQLALELKPDLVIMDVHLPEMNGIEATRRIRQQCPDIQIIALTAYNEKAYQRALSDAGAEGFVLKTAEFSELLTVIQRVISIRKRSPSDPIDRSGALQPDDSPPDFSLTERELEVLTCTARGWTNKQIGTHLSISDRTVQVHLQAIYHKFDATNRTEAVLRAISLGIVNLMNGAAR
jgi:DNA-binding NarL/FixJ family response regulator